MAENQKMEYLTQPLTVAQIKERMEHNYVEGVVLVDLSDAIDNNLEEFLDLLSEKLVDSLLLMDIRYALVGVADEDEMLIRVQGDVSEVLRSKDEDDEDEEAYEDEE